MQEYLIIGTRKACSAENVIKRTVEYHSSEWQLMLDAGWMTWTVENNKAVMMHCAHGGSCNCIHAG